MRIAIFTDTYLPDRNGVAISIKQIKEGLEKKGHEIYIFCPKTETSKIAETNVYGYFSIKIFKNIDGKLCWPNKKKISKIIKTIKPNIIHTHSEFNMGIIGKSLALKYSIPLVHTNHTLWDYYVHYISIFKYFINIDKLLKKFFVGIQHFIYPSIKAKERYFGLTEMADFKIVPNAIDKTLFVKLFFEEDKKKLLTKYNLKKTDKIIIFVGRINKEKNIMVLVENLRALLLKNEHYKFLIVGKGNQSKEIENFAKTNNLEGQIILTGGVNWEEMYYYYKISSVFCSLSLSETYQMTVIEALIAGVPAILINDTNYHEMIENNFNGFLIEKNEDTAEFVEKIIKDDKTLEFFKKNCEKTAHKFYSDKYIKEIENYYLEIISKKQQQL